jgi:hypothetical protein
MSDQDNELDGFYTIKSERVLSLAKQLSTTYYIASDNLQDSISETDVSKWEDSHVLDLMGYIVFLDSAKKFVDGILKPPKELVALAKKYNIEDLLIRKENLLELNSHLLQLEDRQEKLDVQHRYKIVTH